MGLIIYGTGIVQCRADVRVVRQALDQEELAALVSAAEAGEPFRVLTGADKAMLYLMAAFSGRRSFLTLRASCCSRRMMAEQTSILIGTRSSAIWPTVAFTRIWQKSSPTFDDHTDYGSVLSRRNTGHGYGVEVSARHSGASGPARAGSRHRN